MSNQSLKDFYDKKYTHEQEADATATKAIKPTPIPTDRFQAAVSFFPMYFNGGSILELGAGNGSIAKSLLSSDLPITEYCLSDISKPRLEGIRKNLKDDRVSTLNVDADDIRISNNSKYDAVIMIALIEHLIDPIKAMTQIRDLINLGGFVYLDTPNIARYAKRFKLLLGQFPSTASKNEGLTKFDGTPAMLYDEGHLHYFTYRSLSLMLTERCGYSKVVKLGYPGGRKPLGKHVHNWLAKAWPEMFSELTLIAYR